MLAYLVREHNTSQTRKIRKIITKKTTKKSDRSSGECDARSAKGCKNIIRVEEKQITAARTKQHEDEEKDTGVRPEKILTTK